MNGETKLGVMSPTHPLRYRGAAAAILSVLLLGTSACAGEPQRDTRPDEISAEAVDGVRSASSVRVRMEQTGPEATDIDLTMDRGGRCAGRITSADGTADIIKIGKTLWLKPDDRFWRTQLGDGAELPRAFENRYLRGGTGHAQLRDMAALCDLDGIHRALAEEVGKGPFVWAKPVTLEGERAETVSGRAGSVVISTAGGGGTGGPGASAPGTSGPVRFVQRNADRDTVTTTFTDWNRPVTAKAPAPGASIDLARLS
ncbi:hypothetical protein [Streptomyces wuyuanensis]|uniref:hypothetical protein n=1 Tax=Streptomyces wuyuanensis TaxID=1196353 RepID=UPI00371F9C7A